MDPVNFVIMFAHNFGKPRIMINERVQTIFDHLLSQCRHIGNIDQGFQPGLPDEVPGLVLGYRVAVPPPGDFALPPQAPAATAMIRLSATSRASAHACPRMV